MTGERDLQKLLQHLAPKLSDETFVFATGQVSKLPSGLVPQLTFIEPEGTTLVLTEADARRAGLPFEFPCRMITINVHSSLEAIGLLAAITAALAAKGIAVNTVSAFYHDHLFVPVGSEVEAICALTEMANVGT